MTTRSKWSGSATGRDIERSLRGYFLHTQRSDPHGAQEGETEAGDGEQEGGDGGELDQQTGGDGAGEHAGAPHEVGEADEAVAAAGKIAAELADEGRHGSGEGPGGHGPEGSGGEERGEVAGGGGEGGEGGGCQDRGGQGGEERADGGGAGSGLG